MQLLTQIDDAMAFVRLPRGVFKQLPLFARGNRVYVPHGGGYVRICADMSDGWATSCPGIKVLDFTPTAGLDMTGEPSYKETKA